MAERNKLASIPGQPLPERKGNFLSDLWDEASGAFARYGRRSAAQRDASLALMSQAADPNIDPFTGAGMKALGLAGLVTHPLAVFPTREEWDQRLQAAGNDSRIGRSIGGFLSDLPSLIDPQMAAGGAATVAPAIFAGMMAKTADLNKLKQAEKLAELGHPASDIRDMTGLHKGLDGKWRFEISDADATMKMSLDDLPNSSGRLGDVLKHDLLYEAYPDLKNAIVWNTGQRGGGYLSPKVSDIGREEILAGGGTLDDQKSVLLHEIMHGVADREGFAGGAAFKGGGGADEWDRYFRDAGEVEARNVQSRMNMSAADLADETNAPWWTQDVPYSQQILSGGGDAPSSVSREQALQGLVGGGDVADAGRVAAVSDDLVSDYQIPDTWYHGSPADIYGPDGTGKFRLTAGETGVPALWASNDPFTAEGYSRGEIALQYDEAAGKFPLTRSWYRDYDGGGGVYGLKTAAKKPLVVDGKSKNWVNANMGAILREAKQNGHDAVIFRNVADNYHAGGPASDIAAFLDEAAFTPDRK